MEVLVLDGKSYVKASKAARDLGYASDYVGQLCRSGQVDAHLIGRTWYVNPDQLGTHRFEKKRMSRVKAREQAKKAIEERRLKIVEEPNNYKNLDIRYEPDDRELIPETKKLEVQSVTVRRKGHRSSEPEYDSETVIENKGNKVRMSGDLTVVDVTDGPIETDTTILTPGRIRSGTVTVTPIQAPTSDSSVTVSINSQEESDTEGENSESQSEHKTFLERIQSMEEGEPSKEPTGVDAGEATINDNTSSPGGSERSESTLPYLAVMLVSILIVVLTFSLSQTISYSETTGVLNSYDFSFVEFISKIKLEI